MGEDVDGNNNEIKPTKGEVEAYAKYLIDYAKLYKWVSVVAAVGFLGIQYLAGEMSVEMISQLKFDGFNTVGIPILEVAALSVLWKGLEWRNRGLELKKTAVLLRCLARNGSLKNPDLQLWGAPVVKSSQLTEYAAKFADAHPDQKKVIGLVLKAFSHEEID